jgi:DNA modification methylase
VEYENQVLLGDCLEILRQLPSDSFDSCVTDVPYGLGNKEPTPEELLAFLGGNRLALGGDFMGKDWEIPTVEVWKEVYRVLKPGAHVVTFGGTRTWDLISMGLRMAGFEKRDTIADEHPGLQWMQSQGMPKSHNVSKAFDKKAGIDVKAEDYTGPVTPEACEWEGWGSGLKPTWEPILVFRKPFKGTLANNVLQHSTGAIHIDACRVKHASKEDFEQHKAQVEEVKRKGGVRGNSWKNASDLSGASDVTEAGRWPPNTVFEHTPECRKAGTKKVQGNPTSKTFHEAYPGESNTKLMRGHSHPGNQHADEDGLEEVEAWECAPGCPVAALDAQSGDRPSTLTGRATPGQRHEHPGTETNPNSTFLGERTYHSGVYADGGGISRVYPQFEQDEETKGRWPPNTVFEHTPECRKVGTKKVKGSNTPGSGQDVSKRAWSEDGGWKSLPGNAKKRLQELAPDGLEEVEAWECAPGCPVAALGEQSGETTSGAMRREVPAYEGISNTGLIRGRSGPSNQHGDSGTAARFYPQFEQELAEPFLYTGKATKKEATLDGEVENVHPTRKPVKLMQWLVRLVNRKGGLVLDPYCGSGSTLVAAEQEEMRWTGIERDKEMYETACQRAGLVRERLEEVRADHAAFDAIFGGDED